MKHASLARRLRLRCDSRRLRERDRCDNVSRRRSNYTVAASVGPFMQVWRGPQQSALMLMAFPTKIDLDKAVTTPTSRTPASRRSPRFRSAAIRPAIYVSMIGERETFVSARRAGRSRNVRSIFSRPT